MTVPPGGMRFANQDGMTFEGEVFVCSEPPPYEYLRTDGWSGRLTFLRFDNCNHLRFKRCSFSATEAAGICNLLVTRGCNDVVFEDCDFGPMNGAFGDAPTSALGFYGESANVKVLGCRFDACHWGIALGVALSGGGERCVGADVVGNTFTGLARSAITGGWDARIVGNVIDGYDGSAIVVGVGSGDVSHDVLVQANTVRNGGGCCVQFDSNGDVISRAQIVDNNLAGCIGVQANKADRVLIARNTITVVDVSGQPTRIGVSCEGVRRVSIIGNEIDIDTEGASGGIGIGECGTHPLLYADVSHNRIVGAAPAGSNGIVVGARTIDGGHKHVRLAHNTVALDGASYGFFVWSGLAELTVIGNHALNHVTRDFRDMTPDGDGRIVEHNRFGTILRG